MSTKVEHRARRAVLLLLLFLAAFPAVRALAAGEGKGTGLGSSVEAIFVCDIILLLVVGRGLGEVFHRLGQPAIMGQLIGGILLGPSLFGWLWPSAQHLLFSTDPSHRSMIDAVSQLGILLLLLLTGMETDLRLVRRVGAACFSISTTGVVVPFICGFALAQFLPDALLPEPGRRVVAGLFLGTALSISSVKIVAMIVREMNFMRRDLGQIIVSSAIIEDTIGWLIIAITFGVATHGKLEALPLLATVGEVAGFMIFSLTAGRRIVFTAIRWTNDTFESEYAVITMIIVIMGVMALLTNAIGVHTVLGAFVAGILVGKLPILTGHIERQLRGLITALFMPVFFGTAGLSADLTVLADPRLALLTVALVAIASFGKFSGAFLGGRIGGMSWKELVAVGSAMNARGSTDVIIATIGLSVGILSPNLFTMIVTMAVITTLIMPPMLRWALGRLPMKLQEKQRMEREAVDDRGFVAGLERLLLVVDDSSIGRFAAHLAGLVGGSRGMPTTLLKVEPRGAGVPESEPAEELEEIKRGARASASAVRREEETEVEKVHLTARTEPHATAELIREEARKGYGMLVAGLDGAVTPKGGFASELEDVARGFDGPLCLVLNGAAKGRELPVPGGLTRILLPVNGTEVSRRAADIALTLARVHRTPVKVLYVSRSARSYRASLFHQREEAVLKDVAVLADRYGVRVETAMHTKKRPEDVICREAAGGGLIVMGVTQRPGEKLFFGDTATAVVANCPVPVVLVASERGKAK